MLYGACCGTAPGIFFSCFACEQRDGADQMYFCFIADLMHLCFIKLQVCQIALQESLRQVKKYQISSFGLVAA